MAVAGKMTMYVAINAGGGALYDFVSNIRNDITPLPDMVYSRELVEGQWGAVGSVVRWNVNYDGKSEIIKLEIEEVDEATHKIVFNVLEGRLVENIYKSFKIIFNIEPKSDGKLADVTFEFEKVNPKMPYPTSFLDYLCDVYKGVDEYNSALALFD